METRLNSERGFTLMELLTVISIIAVLAGLSFTSFKVFRSDAGVASAETLAAHGVIALETTLNTPDQSFPSVEAFSQSTQGPINNAAVARVLPGLMVPRKVRFRFSFDPTCQDASCVLFSFQVNHCHAQEYIRRVRMGDGVETTLTLPGSGCT